MIPYPGASLPLDFARGHTGSSSLHGDIEVRAGSRTISSGQTWRCWVDPGFSNQYLEEPSLPLEVAWVVEVLSGTGTLTAADGYDPTYAYDSSVTTGHSLGTVNVTGAGTYVLPTTYTADDILGSSAVVLKLDCTAGSVEVQQVKLRVWPVGGASGAWVTMPGWSTDSVYVNAKGASVERTPTTAIDSPPSAAWDAASAACAAGGSGGEAGPHDVNDSAGPVSVAGVVRSRINPVNPYVPRVDVLTSLDGTSAQVWFYPHGVAAAVYGIDPDGVAAIDPALSEGVDYICPPNEVWTDDPAAEGVWAQWTGERSREWLNTAATFVVTQSSDLYPDDSDPVYAGPSLSTYTTLTDPVTDMGPGVADSLDADMVDGGVVALPPATGTQVTQVGLSPGDGVFVMLLSSSVATTVIPYPVTAPFSGSKGYSLTWEAHLGVGDPFSASFQPMSTRVHLPPYQVWVPSAQQQSDSIVRHWPRDDGWTGPRQWANRTSARLGRHGPAGYQ